MPRNTNSINSRQMLACALDIEALLKKNKRKWPGPLAQIEVLIQIYLVRQKRRVTEKIKTESNSNSTQTFSNPCALSYEDLFKNNLQTEMNKQENISDKSTQTLSTMDMSNMSFDCDTKLTNDLLIGTDFFSLSGIYTNIQSKLGCIIWGECINIEFMF